MTQMHHMPIISIKRLFLSCEKSLDRLQGHASVLTKLRVFVLKG